MICSKCAHAHETRPRIRYTPTFFHHPIFDQFQPPAHLRPKCSATYHSTVFGQHTHNKPKNLNGTYSKCTGHEQAKNCQCCCRDAKTVDIRHEGRDQEEVEKIIRPSSANKQTRLQKQISFNPNSSTKFENAGSHNQLSNHTLLWYNPEKEILLRECSSCQHHGLPKERKLLELSSCPFYQYDTAQRFQAEKNPPQYQKAPVVNKLASCSNCRQDYLCDKKQVCSQNRVCCEINQKQNAQTEKKNYVVAQCCDCSKGSCKCRNDCHCGSICKCCPKFLPYGTCKCNEVCKCGSSCECACSCCPKNKQIVCPKETYKKNLIQQRFCQCGPECGCGPECRCGPNCKCSQKIVQQEKKQLANANKATKSTGINNGTRKTKMQQTVRKSEPVFKSVTGRRR